MKLFTEVSEITNFVCTKFDKDVLRLVDKSRSFYHTTWYERLYLMLLNDATSCTLYFQ